jgi:hypothetical protein
MLHQIYDIEHRTLRISLGAIVMTPQDPAIFGIPIDFILFGLTLPGVAVFHENQLFRATLRIGYIAVLVATSNAGYARSLIGDRK